MDIRSVQRPHKHKNVSEGDDTRKLNIKIHLIIKIICLGLSFLICKQNINRDVMSEVISYSARKSLKGFILLTLVRECDRKYFSNFKGSMVYIDVFLACGTELVGWSGALRI